MRQKADTLLEEINCLLAKMGRAKDESDWKSRAISLLLKCHRFVSEYQDDGLGPQEVSKKDRILYTASGRNSLKHALRNAATTIEIFRLPRTQFNESLFYAFLA